jgi:hypothetical protein
MPIELLHASVRAWPRTSSLSAAAVLSKLSPTASRLAAEVATWACATRTPRKGMRAFAGRLVHLLHVIRWRELEGSGRAECTGTGMWLSPFGARMHLPPKAFSIFKFKNLPWRLVEQAEQERACPCALHLGGNAIVVGKS